MGENCGFFNISIFLPKSGFACFRVYKDNDSIENIVFAANNSYTDEYWIVRGFDCPMKFRQWQLFRNEDLQKLYVYCELTCVSHNFDLWNCWLIYKKLLHIWKLYYSKPGVLKLCTSTFLMYFKFLNLYFGNQIWKSMCRYFGKFSKNFPKFDLFLVLWVFIYIKIVL